MENDKKKVKYNHLNKLSKVYRSKHLIHNNNRYYKS